jgi:hypothetical protein
VHAAERTDRRTQRGGDAPWIDTLADLERIVSGRRSAYVRYSKGPDHDAHEQSTDTESGLSLPGLSTNPLTPESWWTRPLTDWLARQVCQYEQLRAKNPERFAWVVDGRVVARGPDCEPLLVDVEVLGCLSDALLEEAGRRYEENFDRGQGPED